MANALADDTIDMLEAFDELALNDKPSEILGKVTLSQKGKPQLYHLGYYYRITSTTKTGKVHWRCVKSGCSGGCYLYGHQIDKEIEIWIKNPDHIDEIDAVRIKNLEHRRLLKEKATHSDEAPRKIIIGLESVLCDEEEIVNSGTYMMH
jgi:hypothetical protein